MWTISAAVLGAGGHPARIALAVAEGAAAVAVALAVAVAVGVAGGLAVGVEVGGGAVLAEVHAARTSPSITTMRCPLAENGGDPLARCGCGGFARTVAPITRRS